MRTLTLTSVAVLAAAAHAGPITFRFEGTAEVTLNGASHPGSHYVIVLQADTQDVVVRSYGYDVDGPATFDITGVASGSFTIPVRVFNNTGVAVAGFSASEQIGGFDLLDLGNPGFATYALNTPIGPFFDPAPFSAQFFEIPTTAGPLSLEALNVTFTASTAAPCYPDCNGDGVRNLSDFGCFQTKFALGDPYADCNGDGVWNLSDFGCFQTKYALGCP